VERAGTSGPNRLVRAEFASVLTRELAFAFQGHYDQIASPAFAGPVLERRTRKPSLSNAVRAHTYYSGRLNYENHAVVLMTTPLYGHNRIVVIDAI
jgi:hypothetical protein